MSWVKSFNHGRLRYALACISFCCLMSASSSALAADEQVVQTYSFERPQIVEVTIEGQVYHRIIMPDCTNGGSVGHPALPGCGSKLLIPADRAVSNVTIVPGTRVSLGADFLVEPVGEQFKLSEGPESVHPPTPNPAVYAGETAMPAERAEQVGTHAFRGYDILVLKLQPVEYVPATGELFYYTDLAVVVDTVVDRSASLYRGLEKDARELMSKVDNPQLAASYPALHEPDRGSFDMMILTTPELVSAFQPLADYHNANGLVTEIHTSSDVGSTNPDDVRDYIRNRYAFDGVDYVIIGGDDDVFPAKDLYVDYGDGGGAITDMPGDVYLACLDGTWNYDGDARWGERTDGEGGGDVDLIAEVYMGRAAVGNATEATRFVDKSIWYMNGSHTLPEKVLLVGEHLGFGGVSEYAANTLEELEGGSSANGYTTIGFPLDTCEIEELFERDMSWSQSMLRSRINNGLHILNHLGHGDVTYAMKFYNNDLLSLLNDDLIFVISQTCLAGHYDGADCWAETINIKMDKGAFAVVMNARYGFGAFNSTDGASQRFNREFWDAVYNPSEAMPQLGRANADSKEDNLYRINDDYMRWCYYEIHLFGDPAVTFMGVSGFSFDTNPDAMELCSPPADEAVYTINVTQLGDFAETVTLSASGAPAGASVEFSVDSGIPPFTSVMTVGDLLGVATGDYNIAIEGDSASLHRATLVGLSLADGAPTQVVLATPEDGAAGVALLPTLSWQAAAQAQSYELEIAEDFGFASVVYSATTEGLSHGVDDALGTLSRYFWRVRGVNVCGDGAWSDVFDFITVNKLMPAYYNLQNGETGSYTYYDDDYDGDGNNDQELAWLTNGLGDLTNGVIATEHWNQNNEPYVGWVSIDPVITFHFDGEVAIDTVILHLDDDGGGGGVEAPEDVTIVMGGQTLEFPCTDPPGDAPFAFTLEDLDLTGDTLELTIADYSSYGSYMMLSEVEFYSSETLCIGDLDDDGDIDLADLAELLAHYGMTSGAIYKDGDLDEDGDVDLADLAELLSVYGTTCP